MVNSKQINPGFIKGLKLPLSDEEEKKFGPIENKFRGWAEKLSDRKYFWRFKFLDDLAMFGFKDAFEYLWDRIVRVVTFRNFRYCMKSGWDYFKQGYYSFDFDSQCALDEFVWKLERIANHIEGCNNHVDCEKDVENIRKAITLLKRVMEDDYLDEFEKEVAAKYGDSITYVASREGSMCWGNADKGPFKNKHTGSIVIHKREKETYKNWKQIHKAERAMYTKAHEKRMKEWKQALAIIEEHFFEWWD